MARGVIIQASSRSNGNTAIAVEFLKTQTNYDVIDLKTKEINHFDYEFNNKDDDFNALFKEIASNYEVIILTTPIYWYTMSGLLKVFLDRISDFLKQEKDYGRMLRGKRMVVMSSSEDVQVFDGFTMPFEKSANYLGMEYLGHIHTVIENKLLQIQSKTDIKEFVEAHKLKNGIA